MGSIFDQYLHLLANKPTKPNKPTPSPRASAPVANGEERKEDDWLPPSEIELQYDAPEFPTVCFPDMVRNSILDMAKSHGCPTDHVGGAVLAAIAGAIGSTAKVNVKDNWYEWPAVQIAIIAPSGGSKSPPVRTVMAPLVQISRDRDEAYHNRLETLSAEEKRGPQGRCNTTEGLLVFNGATKEGVRRYLAVQPRGISMYCDELSGWLAGFNQYKQGSGGGGDDRQVWLEMMDGHGASILRANETIRISPSALSIIGTTVPESVWPFFAKNDGLASRMFFIWQQTKPGAWPSLVPGQKQSFDEWNWVVKRLCQRTMHTYGNSDFEAAPKLGPEIFEINHETATKHYRAIEALAYEIGKETSSKMMESFLNKNRGKFFALALIFHVLSVEIGDHKYDRDGDAKVISELALDRAQTMLYYLMKMYEVTLSRASVNSGDGVVEMAKLIAERLKTWPTKLLKPNGIWNSIKHRFKLSGTQDILPALNLLTDCNYLQVFQEPNLRGRGGVWSISPKWRIEGETKENK